MKNKKTFWVLIGALVLLLGVAGLLYTQLGDRLLPQQLATVPAQTTIPSQAAPSQPSETPTEPVELPDFTVYTQDGEPVKLSDFRGKPVVLNFWASWCGPCKGEMPEFQEAYEFYGEEVTFLMVNMTDGYQESVESASGFLADAGYTFPVYFDKDVDAAMEFGVYSIPATFFLSESGEVMAYGRGALDLQSLQKGISYIYP